MMNENEMRNLLLEREALVERIKELECLYDVGGLILQYSSRKELFPILCNRVAKAWRYSDDAIVSIRLSDIEYCTQHIQEPTVQLNERIYLEEEVVGSISVLYPFSKYNQSDFLIEEEKLLKKLAAELSMWFEKKKRLRSEESLKRILEQQDRLAILGEMTAGIAHELNTPLGNILGFSEFILSGKSIENIQSDAKKIRQSALHAREIVKKLMFFSCEIPQNIRLVDVNSLIVESLSFLNPVLTKANIQAVFNPRKEDLKSFVDSVQYTQVVFNLIKNSIEASKKGDEIHIETWQDTNFFYTKVTDFGGGIPENEFNKIFEPFFTTKQTKGGTGLGLSVVHGIVKSHKGRIQMTSELNRGTTFVVSLPLKQ